MATRATTGTTWPSTRNTAGSSAWRPGAVGKRGGRTFAQAGAGGGTRWLPADRHAAAVLPGRAQEGVEDLLRRQGLFPPPRLALAGRHDLGEGPDHVRLLRVGAAVAILVNGEATGVALHVEVAATPDPKDRRVRFEAHLVPVKRDDEVRYMQGAVRPIHGGPLLIPSPVGTEEPG